MALAAVVAACAGALLGVLLLGWFVRHLLDRRAARHIPGLDPYYAAALADRAGHGDVTEPATAALLRAGLIGIDDVGMVTVTPGKGEPEHPIEAAMLAWYARAEEPVTLRRARWDEELRARRDAFVREESRRLPRGARPMEDGLRGAALFVVFLVATFYAVQVVYFGALEVNNAGDFLLSIVVFLVFWLLILVPAVWITARIWPKRRNLLREHCAAQPPYPAVAALSSRQRELLRASRDYRTPAEKERAAAALREAENVNTGSDTF
ncbi:hypothetical protein [Actinoplanes sp. NPDC023714]|uniref:hypothetical protein n=1 Tax=Actinoplanes sp. NPDC023714 TaxID=3154322 RepID=UPI0033C699DC